MALSFTLQAVGVSIAVVISIVTVDKLGAISLPQPIPPVPRVPKAIAIVASDRGATSSPSKLTFSPARPFVAPTHIPVGVPVIQDGPEMIAQSPFVGTSSGSDGIFGSIGLTTNAAVALPPPPSARAVSHETPTPKVVKLGGNVLEAKLVKRVMPVYPPLARQMRLSGTVRLEGIISRTGRVINLQVVSGHPMLAPAALDAVRQWVYSPTLLNGEPVEVIAPIEVHFTLSQ
jgi:protein TonB